MLKIGKKKSLPPARRQQTTEPLCGGRLWDLLNEDSRSEPIDGGLSTWAPFVPTMAV